MPGRPIPSFDEILSRARQLRHDATYPERQLWEVLRDRRLAGLKFRRQQPVGTYIADFLCHDSRLIVELDGRSHDGRKAYDEARSRWLEGHGFVVFRVLNDDVINNLEGVALGVLKAAGIDVQHYLATGAVRRL